MRRQRLRAFSPWPSAASPTCQKSLYSLRCHGSPISDCGGRFPARGSRRNPHRYPLGLAIRSCRNRSCISAGIAPFRLSTEGLSDVSRPHANPESGFMTVVSDCRPRIPAHEAGAPHLICGLLLGRQTPYCLSGLIVNAGANARPGPKSMGTKNQRTKCDKMFWSNCINFSPTTT
jgi:hypothetical protein